MGFFDWLRGLLGPAAFHDPILDPAALSDEKLLDSLSDIAFRKLSGVDDDLSRIEEPFRTIAIVYAAQGVIDNGGLRYFFESDWPRKPPYSVYADAYERIGRVDAANSLRSAAASFGIDRPEANRDARLDYINEHFDKNSFEVEGWNDCVCGDKQVWSGLAAWARKNYERASDGRSRPS